MLLFFAQLRQNNAQTAASLAVRAPEFAACPTETCEGVECPEAQYFIETKLTLDQAYSLKPGDLVGSWVVKSVDKKYISDFSVQFEGEAIVQIDSAKDEFTIVPFVATESNQLPSVQFSSEKTVESFYLRNYEGKYEDLIDKEIRIKDYALKYCECDGELPSAEFIEVVEPIDTSTWQTYRNEEFGFEFRHPKDFILEQRSKSIRLVYAKEGYPKPEQPPEYLEGVCLIDIFETTNNDNKLSLFDWVDNNKDFDIPDYIEHSKKFIQIDKRDFFIFIYSELGTITQAFLLSPSGSSVFHADVACGDDIRDIGEDVFYKILETVKFLP